MKLAQAEEIAHEISEMLAPFCERISVVGSIRRRRPTVNDIDIVCCPRSGDLRHIVPELTDAVLTNGPKSSRFIYKGAQVDLYYASEETWATLLLIRTGSKESNIRLATRARALGMHLKASGDGLFNVKGERVAGDSERSIFEALGLHYVVPVDRG